MQKKKLIDPTVSPRKFPQKISSFWPTAVRQESLIASFSFSSKFHVNQLFMGLNNNIGGGAGEAGGAFAPPTFSKNLSLNITDFL